MQAGEAVEGGGEIGFRADQDRLLLWPAVNHQTGVSRTTAWRMERAGDFPARVQLSPGRVGWWESELTAWKRSRHLACQNPSRVPGRAAATREQVVTRTPAARPTDHRELQKEAMIPTPKSGERMADAQVTALVRDMPVAQTEAPDPVKPSRRRPRRDPRVSQDQMGFDF